MLLIGVPPMAVECFYVADANMGDIETVYSHRWHWSLILGRPFSAI